MAEKSGWMFRLANNMAKAVLLILLVAGQILPAQAQDSLMAVMQRMQTQTLVKIAYQETRYLELLDKPWLASGFFYALAPDILIKEQQQPSREIMGVTGAQLYYYDPVNDVRHHGQMANDDPISLNVVAFKALIMGDLPLLEQMYQVSFKTELQRWSLILLSRDPETPIKVIINGLEGQPANQIIVYQGDGDRHEFSLTPLAQDQNLDQAISKLNQKLIGE